MADRQVLRALRRLFRIVEAGERGFATAATNANNQGLKLLFKSYAQQRAQFKQEIQGELQRLGGDCNTRSSIPGMIHRGRVAIFAAMTIEEAKREKVILKEAAFGERFAARAYQQALETHLPGETREIVARQFEEVQKVINQVETMLGRSDQGMVFRLYDTEVTADTAIASLERAGIPGRSIEKLHPGQPTTQDPVRGTTVLETILSGMFGGTLWGTLIGILAGAGAVQAHISEVIGLNSAFPTWALVAATTVLLAAVVGGIIGLFIGIGISEDDTYMYRQSLQQKAVLVRVMVEPGRANEARKILDQDISQPGGPMVGVSA